MMKSKKLIILFAVLVILLGSYILITMKNTDKKQQSSESEGIELLNFDTGKIKSITLKYSDTTLILEKSGEGWIVQGSPETKLDNYTVDSLASSLAGLHADKIASEDQENLESYGLKTPLAELTVLLDDGTQKTIYVGNMTPGNEGHYASLKDDGKIYVIPYADGNRFKYTLSDLRDKDLLPDITAENITYMKLVYGDGRTVEIKQSSESIPDEQQFSNGTWIVKQAYKNVYSANSSKISSLASSIAGISIDDVAEDNAADITKYGLDKPSLKLTVTAVTQTEASSSSESQSGAEAKTVTETHEYIFGSDADEDHVYFKLEGSNAVYIAEKSKVEALNVDTFTLIDKFAHLVNISTVDSVIIEGQGQKHEMTIARTTQPKAESQSESESEEVVTTYKVDGKEMEEDAFKELYQDVIGLTVDAENNKTVPDNAEVKITFNLNTGAQKQQVITYSTYNNDFYAVFRNGNSDFLIAKDKVHNVIQKVEEAANK